MSGPLTFDWKRNPNHSQELADGLRAKLNPGDPQKANEGMQNTLDALVNITKKLKDDSLGGEACDKCKRKGPTAESLAKTASYLAKTMDEVYRLFSFAGGGPDSRTEVGLGDLLELLTPDQFEQFQLWIAGNKATLVNDPDSQRHDDRLSQELRGQTIGDS